jgi:hypothetical protein
VKSVLEVISYLTTVCKVQLAITTNGVKFEKVVLKFMANSKHKHEVAEAGGSQIADMFPRPPTLPPK